MSEMIERVADAMRLRAIERGQPVHPTMLHHLAAAAIEAMRDPTDEMIFEGSTAEPRDSATAEIVWGHMIDAALGKPGWIQSMKAAK